MVQKQQAIDLRKQGLSYAQIVKELGCSLGWCKLNLKEVPKNVNEKAIIRELVKKAKSNQGLTSGEIRSVCPPVLEEPIENKSQQLLQEQKQMRRLKTKVKAEPDTIVRPYWMKPTAAKKSLDLVLQAVNLIDERIYEEVQAIIYELDLDETYIKSLTYAITQMSFGGNMLVPNNIRQLTESLVETANELEKRNT